MRVRALPRQLELVRGGGSAALCWRSTKHRPASIELQVQVGFYPIPRRSQLRGWRPRQTLRDGIVWLPGANPSELGNGTFDDARPTLTGSETRHSQERCGPRSGRSQTRADPRPTFTRCLKGRVRNPEPVPEILVSLPNRWVRPHDWSMGARILCRQLVPTSLLSLRFDPCRPPTVELSMLIPRCPALPHVILGSCFIMSLFVLAPHVELGAEPAVPHAI